MHLEHPRDLPQVIRTGGYDHLDFGCSTGGSLELSRTLFNGKRGLGIDRDLKKVEQATAAGFDAVVLSIHDIPDQPLVRFTVLSHFLEHIPVPQDVKAFVRKACVVSTEFVYIQQPFFDADGHLAQRGFKLYWSDWHGHPNRMTTLELWLLVRGLRDAGLPIAFSIHHRGRVAGSADPRVHPLTAPTDQHGYDPAVHPAKLSVRFDFPVFAETVCLITRPGTDHLELLGRIPTDRVAVPDEVVVSTEPSRRRTLFGVPLRRLLREWGGWH
jgi:hypothetical protein